MKIGVLTPHRQGREMFDWSMRRMVERQTRPPDEYVIVDYPSEDMSKPDLADRIDRGVEQLKSCDRIYIMEDDDYYAPTYIARRQRLWVDAYDMTALSWMYYYHIGRPGWHKSPSHAFCGLCTFAFRPGLWLRCRDAVRASGAVSIDRPWWTHIYQKQAGTLTRVAQPDIMLALKHGLGECVMDSHRPENTMYTKDSPRMHWLEMYLQDDPEMFHFYRKLRTEYILAEHSAEQRVV